MTDRDRTLALAGGIAIVLLVLVAFGYAMVSGRPIAEFAPTVLGFAVPVITSLWAMARMDNRMDHVQEKVDSVQGSVTHVEDKVNGNYSALEARNNELQTQVMRLQTGEIPRVDMARRGRHYRPDPGESGRFSASAGDYVSVDGPTGIAHASAETRTVAGLVLPWESEGMTTAGPLKIGRGAVRVPRDISRVKLHFNHSGTPGHRPVGQALGWESRDDGLYMTFRIARTPDGDAAIQQIQEGVYDAFSAELAGIRRNGNDVFDSLMTGVALVDTPAFADARIKSLQAQYTNTDRNTMNVLDFILAMIRAGQTEDQARASAREHFGADEVDAITSDQLAVTPVDPPAAPQTPPVATPPAPAAPQSAPAAPAVSASRPAIAPQGVHLSASTPRNLSVREAANAIYLRHAGQDVAHFALADITGAAMIDATPPQWLGDLWSGVATPRTFIPLLNKRDLTSWRIQGFRWREKPMVKQYAGNKTEIPTNPVSIEPYESEAVRWAGGHDIDRKFYDFGDSSVLEAYWQAMNESYAVVTDASAVAFAIANATPVVNAAATDLITAMVVANAAVTRALRVAPSFYVANPADQLSLLSITQQNVPAFLGMMGVTPEKITWSNDVPAGTLIAGAKPAITFYELPKSPLRVEAEHVSLGGKDAALFGYTALTLDNAAGIVKVEFAAAPAPAPAG
jgi:phage head maturation protease